RLSLFSIGCTGTYDGQDGDVAEPGDTLCLIVLSAATDSTSQVVTVTIGGNQTGNQVKGRQSIGNVLFPDHNIEIVDVKIQTISDLHPDFP
ncbi:MAG: hypothetical protein HQ542_06975, partial [Bacteroidia bacterium]|nr:hypothetical protein [Bacteroidia bacterium]